MPPKIVATARASRFLARESDLGILFLETIAATVVAICVVIIFPSIFVSGRFGLQRMAYNRAAG
jgi:hypothetical protein